MSEMIKHLVECDGEKITHAPIDETVSEYKWSSYTVRTNNDGIVFMVVDNVSDVVYAKKFVLEEFIKQAKVQIDRKIEEIANIKQYEYLNAVLKKHPSYTDEQHTKIIDKIGEKNE